MQDYRKLQVWSKAHALAVLVHRLSSEIPRQENAGLIGQIRRAALSVPANIAEGGSRESRKDFAKFIQIAIASASELEYHLQFASEADQLPVGSFPDVHPRIIEVRKMLFGLLKRIRATDGPPVPAPVPPVSQP